MEKYFSVTEAGFDVLPHTGMGLCNTWEKCVLICKKNLLFIYISVCVK